MKITKHFYRIKEKTLLPTIVLDYQENEPFKGYGIAVVIWNFVFLFVFIRKSND